MIGRIAGRVASRVGRGSRRASRATRDNRGGNGGGYGGGGGGRFNNRSQQSSGGGDEEAIEEAVDTMQSMVGNDGQQAILDEAMEAFVEWAHNALETDSGGADWPDALGLRDDKYDGTDEIWQQGYEIIRAQSGFHDSADEAGEGTGSPF